MSNQLLTISEFIEAARKQGASFEGGDAKVHLAYLTKLGLLPSAIKKKIKGEIQGCYPSDALTKLLAIQAMKNSGITYSQMSKTSTALAQPTQTLLPIKQDNVFALHIKPSNFAYLALGLVIGVLVSTLNTSGLNAMHTTSNLNLNETVKLGAKTDDSNVYLIAVPKQNLDKLGKTNINYLIKN